MVSGRQWFSLGFAAVRGCCRHNLQNGGPELGLHPPAGQEGFAPARPASGHAADPA